MTHVDLAIQRELAAHLARTDLHNFLRCVIHVLYPKTAFRAYRYLEAMCKAAQDIADTDAGRLLVTVPPRHFKSTVVSVALPAFLLGRDPSKEVLVATQSSEFATLHANQFRRVVESEIYRRLFPQATIDPRNNRVDEVRFTSGGGRKSASVGSATLGRGADVLVIDDLEKPGEAMATSAQRPAIDYYENVLLGRLNEKSSASIIVIQQRLHEYDFAGYLMEKGIYRHLNLPSIATLEHESFDLYGGRSYARRRGDLLGREDAATLERMRAEMTPAVFEAQMQQEPVPAGGNLFDFEGIAKAEFPPERADCHSIAQSWDTAFTKGPNSAYSACTTWGLLDDTWYLLDVMRAKLNFPELLERVATMKARWRADNVVVEAEGSGRQLVDQLRKNNNDKAYVVNKLGRTGKEGRLIEQSARLVSGKFVIPTRPSWFVDLRNEFRAFPNGTYADQVDSVTQFVYWVSRPFGEVRSGMRNRRV